MKKIIAIIITLAMLACLAACGTNTPEETTAANPDVKTFKIGLCNYVDDASLNQIVSSIEAQLTSLGEENNVNFEINSDNCNGDSNVLAQIISNFEFENVDLMIGIATPVAVAMQAATEESKTPVIFSAVSDPVSKELVNSLEAPGSNLTGTSDYLDTNSVLDLIFALKPDAKKIGLLYDVGQDSSETPIAAAKEYLDKKGVAYVEKTGTNPSEVALAANALVDEKVDAVFTPTDNTIMEAQLSIYEIFNNAGIPQFTGADSFALNGAFLGYGVDYANLGKETANMVYDVLVNGKDTATLPVMTFDNGTATINTDTCAVLGYDYDELAEKFAPFCTAVKSITTAESFEDLK